MATTARAPFDDLLARGEITAFCRRWKIRELALFGSVARGEAGPASDVDLLVTFGPDAEWGLLDHVRMQRELERLTGRAVDLVSRRALERSENPIRSRAILASAEPLYVAG